MIIYTYSNSPCVITLVKSAKMAPQKGGNKPESSRQSANQSANQSTNQSTKQPVKRKKLGRTEKARAREAEEAEIVACEKRITDEAPPAGTNPLLADQLRSKDQSSTSNQSGPSIQYNALRNFDELPISNRTKTAMKAAGFNRMTDIQRASAFHALIGRDILGAARTGSGKTIAFLMPMIEKLWRLQWKREFGCGAIVLSPTRELALQIFDVLREIGVNHEFSAGLLIGGKDIKEEAERLAGMTILVATPGRLLQHLDQTYGVDVSNLQILILDEADRLLELGFKKTLTDILTHFPIARQTMLFSATQTKSVRDLARLSLKSPEYLAVHANDTLSTPDKLQQHYMIMSAAMKVDTTYSFIRTHLQAKTLIFLSACKEVRFYYEMFRRLRPGIPLLHLHGKMSQDRRMAIYYDFIGKKEVCMFCTDIAARGLDFPDVDWVVQVDAPESTATYIHRVGRTARYRSGGKALLFLEKSEAKMVDELKASKIQIDQVKINAAKALESVRSKFQAAMISNNELKALGQKALISQLKSIHLRPNKEIFDLSKIDIEALAQSMGLPSAPTVKFGSGKSASKASKNTPYALQALLDNKSGGKKKKLDEEKGMGKEIDNLLKRQATRSLDAVSKDAQEEDDDDDILVAKPRSVDSDDSDSEELTIDEPGKDEDDDVDIQLDHDPEAAVAQSRSWLAAAEAELQAEDAADKLREHERVHEKHLRRRRREKAINRSNRPNAAAEEEGVTLGGDDSQDDDDDGAELMGSDDSDADEQSDDSQHDEPEDQAVSGPQTDALDINLDESDDEAPAKSVAKPGKRSREQQSEQRNRKRARS